MQPVGTGKNLRTALLLCAAIGAGAGAGFAAVRQRPAAFPRLTSAYAYAGAGWRDPGALATPTSMLDWPSALRAATAATLMVQGAQLLAVMPTGSMEPVFNERAVLLLEPAPFDDLRVGDIVTYDDPLRGVRIVHRILEKRGDRYWAKGDANGRMDLGYVTRSSYRARVFGIIYAREPSEQARRFAALRR